MWHLKFNISTTELLIFSPRLLYLSPSHSQVTPSLKLFRTGPLGFFWTSLPHASYLQIAKKIPWLHHWKISKMLLNLSKPHFLRLGFCNCLLWYSLASTLVYLQSFLTAIRVHLLVSKPYHVTSSRKLQCLLISIRVKLRSYQGSGPSWFGIFLLLYSLPIFSSCCSSRMFPLRIYHLVVPSVCSKPFSTNVY